MYTADLRKGTNCNKTKNKYVKEEIVVIIHTYCMSILYGKQEMTHPTETATSPKEMLNKKN